MKPAIHQTLAGRQSGIDPADLYFYSTRALLYLLVVSAVCVMGFPLYWTIISSLKPPSELYSIPPGLVPERWTLENYSQLFVQTNFLLYFKNSLIVALGATGLSLLIGSMGAYALSRFQFAGMRFFSLATLGCYMLPEVLIVIPLYVYIVKLGLTNTLWSLIIGNTTFTLPITLWFMRSYFAAIPAALEESAMIDGCSRLGAMFKVTMPLALPGLISVGVFSFNFAWNEYLFALVFISSESKKVLSVGLATWIAQDNIYSWGMLLAAAVLITVPVVLFYLLVQQKLISGLSEGGVKGD